MAPSSTHELLQKIALLYLQLERPKNRPREWGCLNWKQRRQQKIQQHRKRANVWRHRPLGRLKNQMRGHQQEMWYKIWMLRHLRQLRMGLRWLFLIRGDAGWIVSSYWLDHIVPAGSYRIGWIISYWLDHIVLAGSYQDTLAFMRWLICYWLCGTDGLDGTLVGRGWYVPTLAGAVTGAPPLALKGKQAVGSGGWHQFCWCCKGVDYLYWSTKIIQIDCTKIKTNM